ncbi:DUF3574 domain-containing protein [Streptomyces sp. NBC_00838]|uniref:DUF3574 domain-containing protein n=1 Tax=Streptomyces sp. NBC_00838 TaxID=2903680 RepID=UPI00386FF882|nr:DUF3574 domain-containing protein [Streptomyces sp. NBC_00838]
MSTAPNAPRIPLRPRAPRSPGQRVTVAVAGAVTAVLAVGAPAAYATLESEQRSPAQTRRGTSYIETRLFFGTERPDGEAQVTDSQFMAFIDRHVTPEFPSGLTIQEGRGQWRDSKGVIERERSYELILLYPSSEATSRDARIDRIRDAYERTHAQDSVARLDDRTFADF